MKMEQSVPKRRYINLRRRGITQKKAYNIQYTAKVWNQAATICLYKIIKWLIFLNDVECLLRGTDRIFEHSTD